MREWGDSRSAPSESSSACGRRATAGQDGDSVLQRSGFGAGQSEVPVEGTEQPPHDDYAYALRDEDAYLQADDEKPQIVEPFDHAPIVCQFCGKSYEQVRSQHSSRQSARSGIPTLKPSWQCGSATSALPAWRRHSPSSPQELKRTGCGRFGHVVTLCDREDQ